MHNTKVVMKDGTEHDAPIGMFRPQLGWMSLIGVTSALFFNDMESATTADERGGSVDEIERARRYMRDGRRLGRGDMTRDTPLQEWE